MHWRDKRQSDNIEDRRGMSIPRCVKIGGVSSLVLLALILIGMYFGVEPTILLQGFSGVETPEVSIQQRVDPTVKDDQRDLVAVVVAETEDVWNNAFQNGANIPSAVLGSLFACRL